MKIKNKPIFGLILQNGNFVMKIPTMGGENTQTYEVYLL